MTVSVRNFPTQPDARGTVTVSAAPTLVLAEGATKVARYSAGMVEADLGLASAPNLLQTASRVSGHFSPPVVDSPALFERPIRESYGRYAHPHRRSFSAHA